MIRPGDIVDHNEMSRIEGKMLQKGMNFRPRGKTSIFLMSRRPGALYPDELADGGRTLIYQGHDAHKTPETPDPRILDQPMKRPDGKASDNAKFWLRAKQAKEGGPPERVRVWEKIKTNIWVFNGEFRLTDAWEESDGRRRVFKFQLKMIEDATPAAAPLTHSRVIPSAIKAEVWKRDGGKCVLCGATENLHFDHELPFAKGGTSLLSANIRILCATHNLAKSDRIE